MESVNILTLKNNLSAILRRVMEGEIIQIYNRSRAVALLKPVAPAHSNTTVLGGFRSNGKILGDIVDPAPKDSYC